MSECEVVPPIDPERLRMAMELRGMTARQLAEAASRHDLVEVRGRRLGMVAPITEQYISMILSGQRKLVRSTSKRQQLAAALGVPRDWIEEQRPDPDRPGALLDKEWKARHGSKEQK